MSTRRFGLVVLLALLVVRDAPRIQAQQVPVGTGKDAVKNYSVPEFYDPPNQNQLKSLLKIAEARYLAGGRVVGKGLRLETYRPDGGRELVIEAPDCTYDPSVRTASSAGALRVQTADGRFLIEGEGFLWRQAESRLIISNRVKTVIHQLPDPLSKP